MKPNPCCNEASNLEVIERDAHVEVKRCKVCKSRHFTAFMVPKPAAVTIKGTDTK